MRPALAAYPTKVCQPHFPRSTNPIASPPKKSIETIIISISQIVMLLNADAANPISIIAQV